MEPECPDCGKLQSQCTCDEVTRLKRRIIDLEAEVKVLHDAIDGWRRTYEPLPEEPIS